MITLHISPHTPGWLAATMERIIESSTGKALGAHVKR
jgi:hypothetical protein